MWRGHSHSLTWLIFCMAKPRTKPGTLKTPDMHQPKLQILHWSINIFWSLPLTLGLRSLDCQCHSRQQGGHHRRHDREPRPHRWFNPFLHHQTLMSLSWVHFALLSLQVCCLFGQEVPWAHSQGQVKAQILTHPYQRSQKGFFLLENMVQFPWKWHEYEEKEQEWCFIWSYLLLSMVVLGLYWFSERRKAHRRPKDHNTARESLSQALLSLVACVKFIHEKKRK